MGRTAGGPGTHARPLSDAPYPEPVGEVALGGHGAGQGEIPKYGTAQPTIFWNAGAAIVAPYSGVRSTTIAITSFGLLAGTMPMKLESNSVFEYLPLTTT